MPSSSKLPETVELCAMIADHPDCWKKRGGNGYDLACIGIPYKEVVQQVSKRSSLLTIGLV